VQLGGDVTVGSAVSSGVVVVFAGLGMDGFVGGRVDVTKDAGGCGVSVSMETDMQAVRTRPVRITKIQDFFMQRSRCGEVNHEIPKVVEEGIACANFCIFC